MSRGKKWAQWAVVALLSLGVGLFVLRALHTQKQEPPLGALSGVSTTLLWPDRPDTKILAVLGVPPRFVLNRSDLVDLSLFLFDFRPDRPPLDLSNPNFDLFVTAYLTATAFDIKPISDETQRVQSNSVLWAWNVLPKFPGRQHIDFRIEVEHRSKLIGTKLSSNALGADVRLVEVEEKLIRPGQVDVLPAIASIVTAVIAAFLLAKLPLARR